MPDYEFDPDTGELFEVAPPRDHQIDEAKAVLMERFFPPDSEAIYYGRQLEILLENDFFHWITKKGLNELARAGQIRLTPEETPQFTAHFYSHPRYRYPRRKIREALGLISEFSTPQFAEALGNTGESLADVGFATVGFRLRDRDVQVVDGQRWTRTNHNLDRLIERDGIRYGVEIKNTLGYIDRDEFEAKLAMSAFFGIRPLFVARMMPRSYIFEVQRAGGFSLILRNQHYPQLADDLMRRVRDTLNLPVGIIRALPIKR